MIIKKFRKHYQVRSDVPHDKLCLSYMRTNDRPWRGHPARTVLFHDFNLRAIDNGLEWEGTYVLAFGKSSSRLGEVDFNEYDFGDEIVIGSKEEKK